METIKQLVFMRVNRRRKRGQICTTPFQQGFNIGTDDAFIVVGVDLSQFNIEDIADTTTVELILPPLQERYPNITVPFTDEDGNEQEKTIYGYFEAEGSNHGETPMITLNDLTWEGKHE